MRSVRGTLAVSFLALVALALAGVSALVYGSSRQSLLAKQKSAEALWQARHEARCRAVREEFDARLLRRARTLAGLVQTEPGQPRTAVAAWAVLTAGDPVGRFALPAWAAEWAGPSGGWPLTVRVPLAEDVLPGEEAGGETHYFEVDSEQGTPLQRSDSLGDGSLPLDAEARKALGLLEWRTDDVDLPGQGAVRCVTLKAPVSRFRLRVWPRRSPPPPPRPDAGPGPARAAERSVPAVLVRCAATTHARDRDLAALDEELEDDLAGLEAETAATLGVLRDRLAWICLAAFAMATAGAWWLVGLALAPLGRLTEAVRRVSADDFRLRLDAAELPRELRPVARRLTETLALLERAFAREKQAAADISHELRTPVAALLTATEVALRRPRPAERYEEVLRECRAIALHMNQAVERLLTLARLDAGADVVRQREVEAGELARECLAVVRPLAEGRGLQVGLDCPQPVSLTTDPDKLREILTSLLHNAVEYNRPGGRVDVAVRRENGVVRLAVRDTGLGIPAEARQKVFERFFRVDDSRQSEGVHAGLGLSIARGYAELLGGTIRLESTLGEGSTFTVEVPTEQGSGMRGQGPGKRSAELLSAERL